MSYHSSSGTNNTITSSNTTTTSSGVFGSVYYLRGQSNSGNTDGVFGYFYPLYTDPTLIDGAYHSHTFTGLDREVFYMPTSEMNHGAANPPLDTTYNNLRYQEYATYNVNNTIVSYTNISTTASEPVISVASNQRNFDPFDTTAANTESLRVEELIPQQLRESSERFITLIKDYYEYLNTEGLPTYETNKIVDEHDIDKISEKYLDGIQGEIAKNIPDSAVMDRVSLYKKIVQYYTLKGSEESITTFFRLFFDEIVEVSYPKKRLFELSAGDWKRKNSEFTQSFTTSITTEDLGTEYNWTPFQLKNDDNEILGTGNIIRAEKIVLYDTAPAVDQLVVDLDTKKNLNSVAETWDSTVLNKTFRGYFQQGTSFVDNTDLIKLNGSSAFIDFGDIGNNPEISLNTEEHTFVVRAFPRINKENTEIQPLFSLSKDFESFNSHELFFNKTTNKIGRSFADVGEPRIELDADGESYIFSNFIDRTSIGLSSLEGDKLDHMESFLSPLGYDYNGKWKKTLIQFPKDSGNFVYVHENDPVLDTFTQDDLRFYDFDPSTNTFDGPDNLQIGSSIYGEANNDFSGVTALSEDGLTLAIGSAKNDGGGTNSGSVRVYTVANGHANSAVLNNTDLVIRVPIEKASVLNSIVVGTVISGSGLPEPDSANKVTVANILNGPMDMGNPTVRRHIIVRLNQSVTIPINAPLRIGEEANTWERLGSDIDGDTPFDLLGSDISLNAIGNVLSIGAPKKQDPTDSDPEDGEDFSGEVKVYHLDDQNQWNHAVGSSASSIDIGSVDNSRLGASVSLNGEGNILAIGSGANPNIDFDIGTEEGAGLLLEDFNGFGTTHNIKVASADITSFVYNGDTYTKTNSTVSSKPTYSFTDESGPTTYRIEFEPTVGSGLQIGWVINDFQSAPSNINASLGDTDFPFDDINGDRIADYTQLLPADPTLSFSSDGTIATIAGGGEFDVASTHVYVSGVSHQYDGLFEISSITTTDITYIRSGPAITSNSFTIETGINPQFGEIDGGKTIGARIPERTSNEVIVYKNNASFSPTAGSPSASWSQVGQNVVETDADPISGNTVRLSDDGLTLLVGTHVINDSGQVAMVVRAYVYNLSSNTWIQIGSDVRFNPQERLNRDSVPISLSNDGKTFAVGIIGDGTQENYKGKVEIYSLSDRNVWNKVGQTLEGEYQGDNCGASVSLNSKGDVVVIGSPGNDNTSSNSGQARVFFYSSKVGLWKQGGKNIEGFGSTSNGGQNVSINGTGTRVIVASPGNDQEGTNKGKVEAYQVSLKATIDTFIHAEQNTSSAESRWSIKNKENTVYYTDWKANPMSINPYDIGVKWNKGSKPGDENLPVLPHCDYVKNNNDHIFTLHNRGYLSIAYKHNGTYAPWQDITIGGTDIYDGERLWDILDYAVDSEYLVLLDRPIGSSSRIIVFKVDEYNRYNYFQTLSLDLPTTHAGLVDFVHVKLKRSQIVVGTHSLNNDNIAQIIRVYNLDPTGFWLPTKYTTLPAALSNPPVPNFEFNVSNNLTSGTWLSNNGFSRFDSPSIVNDTSKDVGVIFDSIIETSGTSFNFSLNDSFTLSTRFKVSNVFQNSNILTIGNITLRIVKDAATRKNILQIVSQESGKIDYPISLDKADTNVILDANPREIFSDEYFDSEIKLGEWNNVTIEFTTGKLSIHPEKVITGIRYSINGFKRSKSVDLISTTSNPDGERSPVIGIDSSTQLKIYSNNAFAHISFYNKSIGHTEFEEIEKNLSSNYSNTVTTGINSLLDGGKFEISESGSIIIKASSYGINIWEKLSPTSWISYYNSLLKITDGRDNYITHNGSRQYSFQFFGDDLLLVNGGINNAQQFVQQYNFSDVYNKAQHNTRAKLYYIKSQYTTAQNVWKSFEEFGSSIPFSQKNEDEFRVGLNYGANIVVDNVNEGFAISLEPDSVNRILNGPSSDIFSNENTTNVAYDVYGKVADNIIQSFPFVEPYNGLPAVTSYGGRLNNSAVLKTVDNKPLSYNAVLSYPELIHTTSVEKPLIEYVYEGNEENAGYKITDNEYKGDFVISTAPSSEIYLDSQTVNVNKFNLMIIKGKADRYNGYVSISFDGSNFETIIEGNTLRHLTISPEANFIIGKNQNGLFYGDISHVQYYTQAIDNDIKNQITDYFDRNVKSFYRLIFDKIIGSAIGATKMTSIPYADRAFSFDDLNGHTFNSFLYFDPPEVQHEDNDGNVKDNTQLKITVDYGINKSEEETIYWGDGRLNNVSNDISLYHTYTLDYIGEYYDRKGRASSTGRIQDSNYWQRFSYNIRSGLKVSDWENTFLNLVHPAGLKFFASVILLVIRDNHWYGPKYIEFNSNTRKNYSTLKVEDEYLAPFRTKQPLEDLRWLQDLTAPSENGGYHLPMFQPGWLQGDIRTRRFIFEAGLWTKLARSVPGNNLASRYSITYSDGDPSEDFEIRVVNVNGAPLQIADIVTQSNFESRFGITVANHADISGEYRIAADGSGYTQSSGNGVLTVAERGVATIGTLVNATSEDRTPGTFIVRISDENTSSNRDGQGAEFSITVAPGGIVTPADITIVKTGSGFIAGETITITDVGLGGGGGTSLSFNVATISNYIWTIKDSSDNTPTEISTSEPTTQFTPWLANWSGATNAVTFVESIKQGIITQIKPDGDQFTGIIKRSGDDTNIFINGDIAVSGSATTATILATQLRNKEETISVYGAEEQNQAYLLQDTSSIDINSELFVRSVLMAFKYVIPSLVPQKVFTKRDYEQNLKFKDVDDISSYLPITIKDALDNSDVFMNVGAIFRKINQLDTESSDGFYIERDDSNPLNNELLIDDYIGNWWNDATNDDDVSAPVEFTITSVISGGNIVHGDIVFQNIVDNDGANITIEGLVVGHNNSANRTILIAWKGAINTDTSTTLPSSPEVDQFFRDGVIYTAGNTKQANIEINT